ncbi:hypothetical protein BX285_7011 [Streptomyces sp. 1114.5]|uniref:hypothetical protein n=1 Tax=unclassified Streptomyces TaxID=2593676 RepID=UPI000BD26BB8|nr:MULTISPECIES: hypothetical protein [unclassified Streptomyces]RKT09893.1 hypothetical protein BX285_7011 [Streptomyces sp. 1114.5]SOB88778.1 hypothetical protein SAMN06272789_7086 [Streptomyces sp. 1331.2]
MAAPSDELLIPAGPCPPSRAGDEAPGGGAAGALPPEGLAIGDRREVAPADGRELTRVLLR